MDEYLEGIRAEWRKRHADTAFELETLYFGGGTPSKLGAEGVTRLMALVSENATLRTDAEVTLEANPEDVSPVAARAWRRAGINRVSLGVQSFDDHLLAWMHRTHTAKQATDAIRALHDAGIANVSIDIIFGTPHHVPRNWASELDLALDMDVSHVSVYGLTVEPHTPLGRWVARADVTEAPEESFEDEFLAADAALTAAGFDHYEVSNYGKSGLHSRHNWSYWRRAPYGGLGPSAHEFDGTHRRWNVAPYAGWLERTVRGESTRHGEEVLDDAAVQSEELYLSLRTSAGVLITSEEREDIGAWVEAGWGTISDDGRLRLTPRGWLRLDALANHLTLLRSRSYI